MRFAFPGFPGEAIQFFRGLARQQQPRMVPAAQSDFRSPGEAADARVGGGAERGNDGIRPGIHHRSRQGHLPESIATRASARTRRRTRTTLRRAFAAAARWATQTPAIILRCRTKEVGIGGGVYMPAPETLLAIRNHIARRHEEFREIVGARAVRHLFGELQGSGFRGCRRAFARSIPRQTYCDSNNSIYMSSFRRISRPHTRSMGKS